MGVSRMSLLQDLDALIEAIGSPAVFYLPVHRCTCEDDDGQAVVFGVQLPSVRVYVLHPSLESQFIDVAKQAGLRAVRFDYGKQCPPELMLDHWWQKQVMEDLKRQWRRHFIKEGGNE